MVWVLSLFVLAIVLAVAIWFLSRFYAKATLDTALVRTGFGGRRVVMDGACLALPILHQVQKVSMVQTLQSSVCRKPWPTRHFWALAERRTRKPR